MRQPVMKEQICEACCTVVSLQHHLYDKERGSLSGNQETQVTTLVLMHMTSTCLGLSVAI